jgi:hypothetical protein
LKNIKVINYVLKALVYNIRPSEILYFSLCQQTLKGPLAGDPGKKTKCYIEGEFADKPVF